MSSRQASAANTAVPQERFEFRGLLAWVALALLLQTSGCLSSPLQTASSEFSEEGLEAVTTTLQTAVASGDLGGIVTLIFRRDEVVQVDAVGFQDPDTRKPMARDTIFRIASMSKPIAAVATLILLDEGKLALEDPVDRWLPELANPRVLPHPTAPFDSATPSPRPIRVIDLLTHRSGIVTPRNPKGPLRAALTLADAHNSVGYDQWIQWIGDLPLAQIPGSTYDYGNSFDVLGILVERVSGIPYPDFVRERIFEPLGMIDTAFFVPTEKHARFAKLQSLGTVPASWIPSEKSVPNYPAAAGGLYSTVDDYLRFARMLLGRGELNGVRLLEEETVETMTTNHLPDEQRTGEPFRGRTGFWAGQGFGLGVAIKQSPGVHASELGVATVGSFAWPGVFGTWWQADPKEDLILVFMVPGGEARPTRWAFQRAVYDAIER